MSLEFRHITSYLLWYCSHHANEDLLHEVILSIGYFSVLHHDNQVGRGQHMSANKCDIFVLSVSL